MWKKVSANASPTILGRKHLPTNASAQIQDGLTNLKAAKDLETSKEVRLRTDANYQRITEYIFATYLLGDATKKAEIAPLIDRLNQFIADQRTAYKQSQAQKKWKSEKWKANNQLTI